MCFASFCFERDPCSGSRPALVAQLAGEMMSQWDAAYHVDHVLDGGHPASMHELLHDLASCQVPLQAHGACTGDGRRAV